MANKEEGAALPQSKTRARANSTPRLQLDKGTYILTGQILSQNFQENQERMQKHIYYIQMTGWMAITLMKI